MAVRLENPSPLFTFPGIRPMSDGIWNFCIICYISFNIFCINIPSSIHIHLTIHFAIPKKRQCIKSTIVCQIGSKYYRQSNSDHLILFFLTKCFHATSDLQYLHSIAFCRYNTESFLINQTFISFMPSKLCWLLI